MDKRDAILPLTSCRLCDDSKDSQNLLSAVLLTAETRMADSGVEEEESGRCKQK